jgi:hypothetical protein
MKEKQMNEKSVSAIKSYVRHFIGSCLAAFTATGKSQVLPLTEKEIAQREADIVVFTEQEALRQAESKSSAESKLSAFGLTPARNRSITII